MNTQPKNKVLIIIIAILLIANMVTLSFFLMNKKEHAERYNMHSMMANYLKEEVGFTGEQIDRFDSTDKKYRSTFKPMLDNMSAKKEALYKELGANSFNDDAISKTAEELTQQRKEFEVSMLKQMKAIRDICTPAQLQIFDTGFYKLMVRGRGEKLKHDHKNNHIIYKQLKNKQ